MKAGPEIYENAVCPICSKTVKEVRAWVLCRKNKGNVCMSHCYQECEYMENNKCFYLRNRKEK